MKAAKDGDDHRILVTVPDPNTIDCAIFRTRAIGGRVTHNATRIVCLHDQRNPSSAGCSTHIS